jgi:hypothetical protein
MGARAGVLGEWEDDVRSLILIFLGKVHPEHVEGSKGRGKREFILRPAGQAMNMKTYPIAEMTSAISNRSKR